MKRTIMILWSILTVLMLAGCGKGAVIQANPVPVQEDIPPQSVTAQPENNPDDLLSDRVLSSVTAHVDEDRILRLDAVGRMEPENNGSCGVREVRVYENGQLLQTVFVQEATARTVSGPLGEGYTQSPTVEGAMTALDINSDGSDDLDLYGWSTNNMIPHHYWLWNSGVGEYLYAGTYQGAEPDPEHNQILAQYRVENGVYYTDHYDTNFTLISREVENWDTGTEDFPLREYYEFPDGEETLIWQAFTDYDDSGRTIREIRMPLDGVLYPVRLEELEVIDGVERVVSSQEVPLPTPTVEPSEEIPAELPEESAVPAE